jgi:hypothetical protein
MSTVSHIRTWPGLEEKLVNRWHTKRPFSWGLVLLLDRDTSEIPQLTDSVVSQSTGGMAVKVLHAQDVDLSGLGADDIVPPAEVEVEIHIGADAPGDVPFSGTIDVPSGVLTVGDADQEHALDLGAGRWAVQVDCEPPEHAERVRVWLRPT